MVRPARIFSLLLQESAFCYFQYLASSSVFHLHFEPWISDSTTESSWIAVIDPNGYSKSRAPGCIPVPGNTFWIHWGSKVELSLDFSYILLFHLSWYFCLCCRFIIMTANSKMLIVLSVCYILGIVSIIVNSFVPKSKLMFIERVFSLTYKERNWSLVKYTIFPKKHSDFKMVWNWKTISWSNVINSKIFVNFYKIDYYTKFLNGHVNDMTKEKKEDDTY